MGARMLRFCYSGNENANGISAAETRNASSLEETVPDWKRSSNTALRRVMAPKRSNLESSSSSGSTPSCASNAIPVSATEASLHNDHSAQDFSRDDCCTEADSDHADLRISQDVGLCQDDIILAEPKLGGQPGCWASGHASQARYPKGPQITPFCHQMGRRGTIWDLGTGNLRRISARISPGGCRALNLIFFVHNF